MGDDFSVDRISETIVLIFYSKQELAKLLKKFTELPEEDVKEQLRSPETCTCLNLIFAFLWREWRDSPQMKRLIVSKLNREFSDLIGSKAAKGYIDEINIKSYSLGAALPIIKGKKDATIQYTVFVHLIIIILIIIINSRNIP